MANHAYKLFRRWSPSRSVPRWGQLGSAAGCLSYSQPARIALMPPAAARELRRRYYRCLEFVLDFIYRRPLPQSGYC